MRIRHILSMSLLVVFIGACAGETHETQQETTTDDASITATEKELPMVVISTSLGDITVELYLDEAPVTVANFLGYVDSEFFDGTIFHRVIPGFMVQGGGFSQDMAQKPTGDPIANESGNGLKNERGTLAMARTRDPNSATAQFFVNLVDNGFLNPADGNVGYAVFGRVVRGMEVVDGIAAVPRSAAGPFPKDVPVEPVVIVSARRDGRDKVADGQ